MMHGISKILVIYSGKESYGGIYTFWKNIIDNSPNGMKYEFLSLTEKIPEYPTILKPLPQFLINLSFKLNIHYYVTGLCLIYYLNEIKKYDLVIFNQPTAFPCGYFLKNKIKTINVLHGCAKSCYDAWLNENFVYYIYYKILAFFEKISGNCCDKVLTVSEFSRMNLIHEGIKKPVINCNFGVNLKNRVITSSATNLNQFKNKNEYIMLFVGRFDIGKGSKELTNIMKNLYIDYPDIKLICVSDKPKNYEKLKKYNIEFLNSISDEELVNLYSKSDLFIFPTKYEGYGSVVAEAASFGLPIITTNTGIGYNIKSLNIPGIYINKTNEDITTYGKQILKEYFKRKKYDYSEINYLFDVKYSLKKWYDELKG
ncbi:glycosyltransferase involved in cell wall biosynthesis [Methanococcus maripaludis]|uniref:Glycosyltransferase involved in cell wall biosynthesis n=1 Tax=Methanococcus maripaludis TaxID=39152 RepID=A0A7J9NHY2_METMI|nr:glycosyltransferase family 4 protein [Methanococcus maripaludis]MBA2840130.1 glycosyltransferase involved in cell wall biosynthesis [Methanococcus maripaludis]